MEGPQGGTETYHSVELSQQLRLLQNDSKNNRNSFFTVLEAGEFKTKVLADSGSDETLPGKLFASTGSQLEEKWPQDELYLQSHLAGVQMMFKKTLDLDFKVHAGALRQLSWG